VIFMVSSQLGAMRRTLPDVSFKSKVS